MGRLIPYLLTACFILAGIWGSQIPPATSEYWQGNAPQRGLKKESYLEGKTGTANTPLVSILMPVYNGK
jgi:hypothetical protein